MPEWIWVEGRYSSKNIGQFESVLSEHCPDKQIPLGSFCTSATLRSPLVNAYLTTRGYNVVGKRVGWSYDDFRDVFLYKNHSSLTPDIQLLLGLKMAIILWESGVFLTEFEHIQRNSSICNGDLKKILVVNYVHTLTIRDILSLM